MDISQTAAASEPRASYKGFVIAYVAHHGHVQFGYLGRRNGLDEDGSLRLIDACEYTIVQRPLPNGGIMRSAEANPIDSSPALTTISVRPYATLPLDDLSAGEIANMNRLEKHLAEIRASVSFEAPSRVAIPTPSIVGLDGRKL